jgi:hypothetical protein
VVPRRGEVGVKQCGSWRTMLLQMYIIGHGLLVHCGMTL